MESDKLREDIVSPLLKVSTYKGFTLTGPREAIVRKVYSSQSQTAGAGVFAQGNAVHESSFTQLNFRLLGTSPACMLNARIRLVVPLRFYMPSSDADVQAIVANQAWDNIAVGPRRNGLLKSFSSISTIINNTTSFSVRPDESLAVAEQAFPQCREFGATGFNNTEEGGWFGPDWRGSGKINQTAAAPLPLGDLARLGAIQHFDCDAGTNRAAAERRREFLGQIKRTAIGFGPAANLPVREVITYDYVTDLFIPPFKKFDYPTVSKAPTYIPFADQIELACHWKAIGDIKSNLLLGKGKLQCASESQAATNVSTRLTDYRLQYAGQPYIECEYIVPNYTLPPVITLPAWRTISYHKDVIFTAQAAGLPLVDGTGSVNKQTVTMAPIRIESLPSLVFVWVSDPSLVSTDCDAGAGWQVREYFGKISNFSVTMNERLRILSDRTSRDLYKMFRMYCPNSKMDYFTWSELRQVIVFRSDILCTSASQSVFSPTTITFKMDVERQIQNRSATRSAFSG